MSHTGVPTGTSGNSASMSSGYMRMQPCVIAMPTAIGIVSAVDQVGAGRDAEAHGIGAERIVGTGLDHRRQRIAAFRVFLAHRFRRIPRRILALVDDPRFPERRDQSILPMLTG